MKIIIIAACLLIAVNFSVLGQTGNINRNLLPVGDQEALTANTGTAYRGSNGGVFYNPALLAYIPNSQVSMSGSTYINFDHRVKSMPGPDNTYNDSVSRGFNAVPSTIISSVKYGDFVGTFSVLVPDNLAYSSYSKIRTTETSVFQTVSAKSSELWIGLSGGWKISENFSVGAGLHLINYDFLYNQTIIQFKGVYPERESAPVRTDLQLTDGRISTGALSGSAGVYYRINDSFDIGLKTQSRSLQQWEKTDFLYYQLTYQDRNQKVDGLFPEQVRADYRLPLDATIGFSYNGKLGKLLFDISRQDGHKYNTFPDYPSINRIETENTIRYNLGTELNYSKRLQLLGGIAYNPSAIHSLDGKRSGTREDYKSVFMGFYLKGENTRTGLGIFYTGSNGETICGGPVEIFLDYNARCTVRTQAVGAVLSTGFVF